jgi:WD40 repeat protein
VPPPTKSKEEPPVANRLYSVDLPGHRTDVRSLCLSSDDQILASASNGSLKVWNMKTTSCIRTMDCGYGVCSTFLPGDKHVCRTTCSRLPGFDEIYRLLLEQKMEKSSFTILLLQHSSKRSKRTRLQSGRCKFVRMNEDSSAVVLIKMSNFGNLSPNLLRAIV